VEGKISGRKYERTNIVAGLQNGQVVGKLLYKETMKAKLFEEWFKKIFTRSAFNWQCDSYGQCELSSQKNSQRISD